MTDKKPEALRLAEELADWAKDYAATDFDYDMADQAAAELRRLHEENKQLWHAAEVGLNALNAMCDPAIPLENGYIKVRNAIYVIAKVKEQK